MTLQGLGMVVFVLALACMFVLSCFFIACRRYEDGVVGNFALGLLAICCAVLLYDAWQGNLEAPAPVYSLMILCFSAFMIRHGWRFAMFHWCGFFGWKRPADTKHQAAEA